MKYHISAMDFDLMDEEINREVIMEEDDEETGMHPMREVTTTSPLVALLIARCFDPYNVFVEEDLR